MDRKLVFVLLFAIVCLGADGRRLFAAEKVRIAVTNFNMSFLSAGIAAKRGFFKDEGLDAEVIRMNANIAIAALAAGDIDYTMIFGSVVRAAIRGLPMKVVASFIDGSTHALISRPEFKSVRDLKGKTVGLQAFGTTDHIAAMMMLKKFGVDAEKDVKMLALGPAPARLAALREGVVEAAVISPPGDAEAKNLGFNVLTRAYEVFSFPFVGLGTNLRKLKERPGEVKRTIKALIRANRFIRENRDGAVQILADWGRTTPELAAAAYDSSWKVFNLDGSIPEEGLLAVIDQAVKESKLTREVSPGEVADVTLLREAQRELGIKGR
jgi:NitT/TauT family transport system substrate-binding protein